MTKDAADLETWRSEELDRIDREVSRLRSLVSDKQKQLDADDAKHMSQMDFGLQDRLAKEMSALGTQVEALIERRFAVELTNQVPVAASSPEVQSWDVPETLPKMGYPKGARKAGDTKRLEDAYERTIALGATTMRYVFRDVGLEPNRPLTGRFVADLVGEQEGHAWWTTHRVAELEERVAQLEAGAIPSAFKGVWQRQVDYPSGCFVTRSGSMWFANADSKGIEPGSDSSGTWTLAVKAGRDGKDVKS